MPPPSLQASLPPPATAQSITICLSLSAALETPQYPSIAFERSILTALFRASLVLFTSSRASADPTVDDVVTASDGYTTQWLTFPPKGTMVLNPGMLVWTVGAAGSVYAAFVQPLSINENAYGTNAIGWGKQTYHFTDLVGSDKAEFDFTNGAGQKFIYALDYVRFLNSKS